MMTEHQDPNVDAVLLGIFDGHGEHGHFISKVMLCLNICCCCSVLIFVAIIFIPFLAAAVFVFFGSPFYS